MSWLFQVFAAFGLMFVVSIFSCVVAGLTLRAEEREDFESWMLFIPKILFLFHLAVLSDCSGMSVEEVLEEVRES